MLFNTFTFGGLVILTWLLYYLPACRRFQVPVLILASLIFYAWEQPALLALLLTSIVIYASTSYAVIYGSPERRKLYAIAGVTLGLSILAFFKYSPLVGRTLFQPPSTVADLLIMIPLPVGISFYTFHGISLMLDTLRSDRVPEYRGLVIPAPGRHLLNITLFISFFPQLVAGPILKAHDFLPQIHTKRLAGIHWERCFRLLVLGYFLKMVVADNMKDYTFWIAYPYFQLQSTLTLLVMLFGYSIQIFADFAGYSLIAMGLAGLFGYDVKPNFNFPYIARSFSEFWTRWHISLSTFLKEYLYIPLGGNRKGRGRTYRNLMITMLLGGLWHGAAWSYAVWGGFHGLALAVERFFRDRISLPDRTIVRLIQGVLVFSFVSLAWLLFKLSDFQHVLCYLRALATNIRYDSDVRNITMILFYSLPVILYHGLYLLNRDSGPGRWIRTYDFVVYGFMVFMLLTNSGAPSAFIYFQF